MNSLNLIFIIGLCLEDCLVVNLQSNRVVIYEFVLVYFRYVLVFVFTQHLDYLS